MSIAIKVILIPENSETGNGLAFIRQNESKAIDISNWISSDNATNINNMGFIIKNNIVYRSIKTYLDIEKDTIWVMAKEEMEPMDILPSKKENIE